ncbi:MAG: family 20 glycosylhydrolase, partial [Candidatus Aminicenantes bacterium]|nr:family 20 glycosylhydrolase [Candidatus Aminicenantes bacterium]
GATRLLRRLAKRTGLFFSQNYITRESQPETAAMLIQCLQPGQLKLHEDESYTLNIYSTRIVLSANTDIGVLRGIETFLQLLAMDQEGYFIPAVQIKDFPRFPWRGLLIDPGRHFMPVEVIKRNIEGMAAVKLNVLHFHLTEDQGFRIECKSFPKLHQIGSDGYYYTQAQIKDIIHYASDRGIRVMPEFDIPGHATSWLVAYPEYASAPGPYTIERGWGVKDPTFNPAEEATYIFFDAFFQEMSSLFPDEYIHIGGDENNGKQWDSNPKIQEFKRSMDISDNHALQAYFNKRILNILTKYDRKMVGWDEIFQPGLPKDIVIHSWRGKEAMIESAKRGYQTMLSNGYYIDLIHPAYQHYLNDPIPEDSPLTDNEKKYILGGEATMWAEYVVPETIDSRIWPRTAAIAERLWSPRKINDVENMYQRLETISLQLEEHGLTHIKNYDMLLRRLCNSHDITNLKILVDVIEPLKGYERGHYKNYTSYSPMSRIVDAARPDSTIARNFGQEIDQYLNQKSKNKALYEAIKTKLIQWESNHAQLENNLKHSPILWEIITLSEDLSHASRIGLEALEYLQNNTRPSEQWVESSLLFLEKAREQRGQTELMIISPIEKLVHNTKKK